ncbi:MAG: translocation/assembly module TamB domain-containing protein [Deltaproteobacteria bacterium]|nr:translocation/assembly module TamB domain-containing protein [Deltaproteobacteria bacterium]
MKIRFFQRVSLPKIVKFLTFLVVFLKLTELGLERYLFKELEEEINIPTGCYLKTETWNINIFTLSGTASGAKIQCNGHTAVLTEKMAATFSIKDLLKGRVWLSLHINKAQSDGFSNQSVLYKFVDFLSEEPQKKPLIRLSLKKLSVDEFSTFEKFLGYETDFLKVKLDLDRMSDREAFRFGIYVPIIRNKLGTLVKTKLNFIVSGRGWNLLEGKTFHGGLSIFGNGTFNSQDNLRLKVRNRNNLIKFAMRRNKTKCGSVLRGGGSNISLKKITIADYSLSTAQSCSPERFLNLVYLKNWLNLAVTLIKEVKGTVFIGSLRLNDDIVFNNIQTRFNRNTLDFSAERRGMDQTLFRVDLNVKVSGQTATLYLRSPLGGRITFDVSTSQITDGKLDFGSYSLENINGLVFEEGSKGEFKFLNKKFFFDLSLDRFEIFEEHKSLSINYDGELKIFFNQFKFDINCFQFLLDGKAFISEDKKVLAVSNFKLDLLCPNIRDSAELKNISFDLQKINSRVPLNFNFGQVGCNIKGELSRMQLSCDSKGDLDRLLNLSTSDYLLSLPFNSEFSFKLENLSLKDFTGIFEVKNAYAFHLSGLLWLEDINGVAKIQDINYVSVSLSGKVNSGNFKAEGKLDLFEKKNFDLKGSFTSAMFNWDDRVKMTLDGNLSFVDRLVLEVQIKDGFIKLPEESILLTIFEKTKESRFQKALSILRLIDFDLKAKTLKPIALSSETISTSLWGDINVNNSGRFLSYTGEIQLLGGTVNISSNSFSIKRGDLTLNRDVGLVVNILGGKSFYYARSFPIEIFVNIYGPVDNPSVKLFSLPELDKDEIQRIVFSRDPAFYNLAPRGVTVLKNPEIGLFEIFPRFFKDTFLPSEISVDIIPDQNEQTSYTLQLSKDIFPNVKIIGESAFYSTYTINKLKASLSVLDRLQLLGELSSNPLVAETGLSADMIYVFQQRPTSRLYEIKGNKGLSETILRSKLPMVYAIETSLTKSLEKILSNFYLENGFSEAKIKAECVDSFEYDRKNFCLKIVFTIDEGPRCLIDAVTFDGIDPNKDFSRQPCSPQVVEQIRKSYFENKFSKNLIPLDTSVNRECSKKNELFACSLNLVSKDFLAFETKGDIQPKIAGELLFSLSSFLTLQRQYEDVDKLLKGFAKFHTLKQGRVLSIVYLDHEKKIILEASDAALEIIPEIRDPEHQKLCSLTPVKSQAFEIALLDFQSKLRDCGLVVNSYATSWENSARFLVRLDTTQLKNVTVVLPDIEGEKRITTTSKNELDFLTLAVQKLKEEGFRVSPESLSISVVSDEVKVSLVNTTELIINEIRIVMLKGSLSDKVKTKLKDYIGHKASQAKLAEVERVLEKGGLKIFKTYFDEEKGIFHVLAYRDPEQFLKGGIGFHSELGVHGFLLTEDQSLFPSGQSVLGKVDVYVKDDLSSLQTGSVSLSYLDPLVDFDNLSWDFVLFYQRTRHADLPFNSEKYGATAHLNALNFAGLKNLPVKFKVGLVHDFVFDIQRDLDFEDSSITSPFAGLEIKRESINDLVYPTDGYSLKGDFRAGFLDFNYIETKLLASNYFKLFENGSIHSSIKFNQIVSAERVPIPYRYFVGGRDTLRGYSLFKFGKKGPLGSPYGGERFISLRNEFHWRFYDQLILVGFNDTGIIDEFSKNTFGVGLGLGFKYLSPVGPIGFEVARGVYENDSSKDLAFYLSLGITF